MFAQNALRWAEEYDYSSGMEIVELDVHLRHAVWISDARFVDSQSFGHGV
jgi:hypothetical protein